jgi:hypothetical protein
MSWGNILFLGGAILPVGLLCAVATIIAMLAGVPRPLLPWIPQAAMVLFVFWFFRWRRRM